MVVYHLFNIFHSIDYNISLYLTWLLNMKYIMLTLEVCSFILFSILLNLHNKVPSGFTQRRILVFLFNTISIAEIKVSLNIWDFLYVTVSYSCSNFSTVTAHANMFHNEDQGWWEGRRPFLGLVRAFQWLISCHRDLWRFKCVLWLLCCLPFEGRLLVFVVWTHVLVSLAHMHFWEPPKQHELCRDQQRVWEFPLRVFQWSTLERDDLTFTML